METLDQSNQRAAEFRIAARAREHLAGVACDKCGVEMHLTNPGMLLMSCPPKSAVHCPACGERGYLTR